MKPISFIILPARKIKPNFSKEPTVSYRMLPKYDLYLSFILFFLCSLSQISYLKYYHICFIYTISFFQEEV